jgi:hypothetical protein
MVFYFVKMLLVVYLSVTSTGQSGTSLTLHILIIIKYGPFNLQFHHNAKDSFLNIDRRTGLKGIVVLSGNKKIA